MTNTTISNFINKLGPRLKAKFVLSEKGITNVAFVSPAKSSSGMAWEIEGSSKGQQIEKMIEKWMTAFCKRQQPKVELPIVLDGLPPFTLHVLSILRSIPFGVSVTYQELAEIAGNPNGARAVGNACGRNPCPLIVPCHRVLASKGIGGFSMGGIEVKKALLSFENKH